MSALLHGIAWPALSTRMGISCRERSRHRQLLVSPCTRCSWLRSMAELRWIQALLTPYTRPSLIQ